MRNLWLTIVFVATAAAASFAVVFLSGGDPDLRRARTVPNPVVWLQSEFHLNDSQFAVVQEVHDAYMRECNEHCERIRAARGRSAPAAEIAGLEETCVASMTAHFQRVAKLLPAGEGDRYLALVLPKIKDYDHLKAPTVLGG